MQTVKTHVHPDGTTTITCPVCSRLKRVSVAGRRHEKHVLRVRCRCETVFRVLLNYRRHHRKTVSLSGTYKTLYQYDQCKGVMQITNLSAGGLQYQVIGLNRLGPGSILDLDFQLDDRRRSQIQKHALVRYVHKNVVGCEFVDRGDSDRALAFYLRP
jgi:uncharacterized C2H2 Zn-finger protein